MTTLDLNQEVSAQSISSVTTESISVMNQVQETQESSVVQEVLEVKQTHKQIVADLRVVIADQQALIILASETLLKLHLKNAALEEQLSEKVVISTDEEEAFVDVDAPLLMSFEVPNAESDK